MYDDYRGDGTLWTHFDGAGPPASPVPDPDGPAYYDGLIDCPQDWVQFCMTTVLLAPTIIPYDSMFFFDTDVIDVSGFYTGIPGDTFTPTYDMTLPAGTYTVCKVIDPGNQVLP
jgi:hypothetical protein